MTTSRPEALVIGAGVIGLTTAIRLAESGVRTHVWTADDASATTSYAAGASWGPHLVADHPEVTAWGLATLEVHRELASVDGSGVRLGFGVEASPGDVEVPAWAAPLGEIRMARPDELPPGYATGWRHSTPLIDMPRHLAYLRDRLLAAGGRIESRRIASLAEVEGAAAIVVNATGIGAAALTGDDELRPVRGQVVVCTNPGISEFFVGTGESELTYFFPHDGVVVLGGQSDEGNWSTEPDPVLTEAIVARCVEVEPRLRGAEVVGVRVGLRPYRSRVRVEAERRGSTTLIHNYGHGGAGVTLSWGCADEVLDLATTCA